MTPLHLIHFDLDRLAVLLHNQLLCAMDGWDLQRLRGASSLSDSWPGGFCALTAFDPTADPEKPPRYYPDNLLLTQQRVQFRSRLVDGSDRTKSYSRQKADLPGLLIKTMLPVDLTSWPALLVHMCYSCFMCLIL